ncbi:MAG: pseudouridine synthase [Sphingobacteriaceae bacterium]
MPFQGNRNSRDDKSKKSAKSIPAHSREFGRKKREKSDRHIKNNNELTSGKPANNNHTSKYSKRSADFRSIENNPSSRGREKPSNNKSFKNDSSITDKKVYRERSFRSKSDSAKDSKYTRSGQSSDTSWNVEERSKSSGRIKTTKSKSHKDHELIRLNRYIANAGICSRRKADELIAAGVISVNGEAVTELGFKVNPAKDVIRYNGRVLKREKMVYVLLNKPKDYITTTDDPQERKTVMSLIEKASSERIYPIGRLDRNTTGLLLLTNDGDLAEKLSHPRNQITKIYQVELNKNLTQGDFNKIAYGIELEDGFIKPDAVSYVAGGGKNEIGIQIHSGKNRVVRRIFESLGYEVVKLDRVIYANLTKKDLPRGRWRYLEEKEIIQLKHLMQTNPK